MFLHIIQFHHLDKHKKHYFDLFFLRGVAWWETGMGILLELGIIGNRLFCWRLFKFVAIASKTVNDFICSCEIIGTHKFTCSFLPLLQIFKAYFTCTISRQFSLVFRYVFTTSDILFLCYCAIACLGTKPGNNLKRCFWVK